MIAVLYVAGLCAVCVLNVAGLCDVCAFQPWTNNMDVADVVPVDLNRMKVSGQSGPLERQRLTSQ